MSMRLSRPFVLMLVLVTLTALAPRPATGDTCSHRGKLDTLYCDEDRDGLADLPKDKAKIQSPDPLVFA